MEKADIGCAVAEHTDSHAVILAIRIAQRQARRDRQVRAHNGMPTPEIQLGISHVHRTAFAFGAARGLPQQFCHNRVGADPGIDRHPMIAVCGDHPVLRLAGGDQPGADGLLPDIQVQEPPNFALLLELRSGFLHQADQDHLVI